MESRQSINAEEVTYTLSFMESCENQISLDQVYNQ